MTKRLTREQSEAILLIRRALQDEEPVPQHEDAWEKWAKGVSPVFWWDRLTRNPSFDPAVSFAVFQDSRYFLIDGYLKLFLRPPNFVWRQRGNREFDGLEIRKSRYVPATLIEIVLSEILYGAPDRIVAESLPDDSVGIRPLLQRFRRSAGNPFVLQWVSRPTMNSPVMPLGISPYGQTRAVQFFYRSMNITRDINPFLSKSGLAPIAQQDDANEPAICWLLMDFTQITPDALVRYISQTLYNDPNHISVSML